MAASDQYLVPTPRNKILFAIPILLTPRNPVTSCASCVLYDFYVHVRTHKYY